MVEFRVLGPLEVRDAGREVLVAGEKQRRLLIALVLRVGEVVATGQLMELLWPGRQPTNPRNALQSQVAQLRRSLGARGHDLVRSRPPGYVLSVDDDQVDARRFERLVREARVAARHARPDEARAGFEEALALWRGDALEEVAHEPFAVADAARLEEGRLAVVEDLVDARLAVGEGPELVPELESAVSSHPLRERRRGQLMLALFRAGRQADALELYQQTRRVLDEELGIEPGPALTELHRKVLLQHDDLAAPHAPDPDLPDAGPPRRRVMLPVPVSSFIGRSADLERVAALLGAARSVTLTGPGGVGKTRLATEVARRADARAGDAALPVLGLVELASVSDAIGVVETIARGIGLGDDHAIARADRGPLERLVDALHHRRGLLVLDNCEHLLDEVAVVTRTLLERCPDLWVLATSRAPLGITGEAVWSLPSLDVPDPATEPRAATLPEHDATRLFLERARDADPTFTVDDEEARAIVELCRRLDGIPLALELAAARVRMLPPVELLSRLDDRFGLLASTDRTRPARQRTLREVVDWSWQLCTAQEQRLFRRLGVLTGSATLTDIEAFAADDVLTADRVLDALSGLVDRSLVVRDRRRGRVCFRLLETLRAYAVERLDETGERAATEQRLLAHLTDVARTEVPRLRGVGQLDAKARLDDLHDDLVAALEHASRRGEIAAGGALASELCWHAYLRGERHLVLRWAEMFEAAAPEHAASLTIWAAFLSLGVTGDAPDLPALTERLEVIHRHGTQTQVSLAELIIADIAAQLLGDGTIAGTHLTAARAAATAADEPALVATTDFVAALPDLLAGDQAAARQQLATALEGFRAAGERWGQVQCLYALLGLDLAAGDVDAALRHADEGLATSNELGLRELTAVLQAQRCEAALLVPDLALAADALDAAELLATEIGALFLRMQIAHTRAGVALLAGDLDGADRSLRDVLDADLDDSFAPLVRTARLRAAEVASARRTATSAPSEQDAATP